MALKSYGPWDHQLLGLGDLIFLSPLHFEMKNLRWGSKTGWNMVTGPTSDNVLPGY